MAALDAELGAGIDVGWVVDNLGPPLETVLARWLPPGDVDRAAWRYRELFETLGISSTQAMPGAVEALDALRKLDGRVVVVTAKFERDARMSLEVIGVEADVIVGWRYGAAKAETLREHHAEVYVGDHPADVVAAREAGVVGVMVATGAASSDVLADVGADVVLTSLDEFPAWLGSYATQGPTK